MPHRTSGYYNLYSNSNLDYNYYSNVRRPAAAMGNLAGIALTNPNHLAGLVVGEMGNLMETAQEQPLLYGGLAAVAASMLLNVSKSTQDTLMKGGAAAVAAHFILPMLKKDQGLESL
jgi:hypothetical protein